MARERGLGGEVHDGLRVAGQQMAGDGEATGDVAEALAVLRVQEQREGAGRPNWRHGRPSPGMCRSSVNERPNNNRIRTTASLKPRTAAGRGLGSQVVYQVVIVAATSLVTRYQGIPYSLRRTCPTGGCGVASTHTRHAGLGPSVFPGSLAAHPPRSRAIMYDSAVVRVDRPHPGRSESFWRHSGGTKLTPSHGTRSR